MVVLLQEEGLETVKLLKLVCLCPEELGYLPDILALMAVS